jgi:hypothetical protein
MVLGCMVDVMDGCANRWRCVRREGSPPPQARGKADQARAAGRSLVEAGGWMKKYICNHTNGWYIYANETWTSFEARKDGESVVLVSSTLEGLNDLINMRNGQHVDAEKSNRTRFNPEPNWERIKRIFGGDLVRYRDVYDKITGVMCKLYDIYNRDGIPNEEHYYELWDALDGLLDSVDSVQQEYHDK